MGRSIPVQARVEYLAVAHLNRVAEQSNKKECSYPLVMHDVSLSVRQTSVHVQHSSYKNVSRMQMSEGSLIVEMRRRT